MQPSISSHSQWVRADLYCLACHYNLRGLPFDGQCPECARLVADSSRFWSGRRKQRQIAHLSRHARRLAWIPVIFLGSWVLYVALPVTQVSWFFMIEFFLSVVLVAAYMLACNGILEADVGEYDSADRWASRIVWIPVIVLIVIRIWTSIEPLFAPGVIVLAFTALQFRTAVHVRRLIHRAGRTVLFRHAGLCCLLGGYTTLVLVLTGVVLVVAAFYVEHLKNWWTELYVVALLGLVAMSLLVSTVVHGALMFRVNRWLNLNRKDHGAERLRREIAVGLEQIEKGQVCVYDEKTLGQLADEIKENGRMRRMNRGLDG